MDDNLRILDANFNRAREALRVLEDYSRFVLNDSVLSASAKEIRHELCQCLSLLPGDRLIASRDTPGDVGTSISTATEKQRHDSSAVARASASRLSEALRCLEEYGRLC